MNNIMYLVGRFSAVSPSDALKIYQTVNGPDARIFIKRHRLNVMLSRWMLTPVEITIEELESCVTYERLLKKLPR